MGLPLALTASCLLNLLLVLATSTGARTLSWCGFACCALYLLALLCVGDALGVCHVSLPIFLIDAIFRNFRGAPAGQTSPPASLRRAVEIVL